MRRGACPLRSRRSRGDPQSSSRGSPPRLPREPPRPPHSSLATAARGSTSAAPVSSSSSTSEQPRRCWRAPATAWLRWSLRGAPRCHLTPPRLDGRGGDDDILFGDVKCARSLFGGQRFVTPPGMSTVTFDHPPRVGLPNREGRGLRSVTPGSSYSRATPPGLALPVQVSIDYHIHSLRTHIIIS